VDKVKEKEEETDLKEEVVTTLTSQTFNCMKQIGQLVTLTMAIWNPGLTNQKLNVIIVKR